MKTYFKSTVGDIQLMLDDETKKIQLLQFNSFTKSIAEFVNEVTYNKFLSQTTDINKWTSSTEEEFNSTKNEVITNI